MSQGIELQYHKQLIFRLREELIGGNMLGKQARIKNSTLEKFKAMATKDMGVTEFSDHSAFPYQHLDGIEFYFEVNGKKVRVNAWQSDENLIVNQVLVR